MDLLLKLKTSLKIKNPLEILFYCLSPEKDIKLKFYSKTSKNVYGVDGDVFIFPRVIPLNRDNRVYSRVYFERAVRMAKLNYEANLTDIKSYLELDNMLSAYIIMYRVWFPKIFQDALNKGKNYVQIFKDEDGDIFHFKLYLTEDDYILPFIDSMRLKSDTGYIYKEFNYDKTN